jgi:hypothetical protein
VLIIPGPVSQSDIYPPNPYPWTRSPLLRLCMPKLQITVVYATLLQLRFNAHPRPQDKSLHARSVGVITRLASSVNRLPILNAPSQPHGSNYSQFTHLFVVVVRYASKICKSSLIVFRPPILLSGRSIRKAAYNRFFAS